MNIKIIYVKILFNVKTNKKTVFYQYNLYSNKKYCAEKPNSKVILKYYQQFKSKTIKREKVIIKKLLSLELNKCDKQIDRYFKDMEKKGKVEIKRGYGRKKPISEEDCFKLTSLLIDTSNVKEIVDKLGYSYSKSKRLIDSIYIPRDVQICDDYIVINFHICTKDLFLDITVDGKDIFSSSINKHDFLISICHEISDYFNIFEIKKVARGESDQKIRDYYQMKMDNIINNILNPLLNYEKENEFNYNSFNNEFENNLFSNESENDSLFSNDGYEPLPDENDIINEEYSFNDTDSMDILVQMT